MAVANTKKRNRVPADPETRLRILVASHTPNHLDTRALARFAKKVLRFLGVSQGELSIALCNDPFVRRLNEMYRGIPKTTDVLSFAQDERIRIGAPIVLGDIVVCVPQAARQAKRRGCSVEDEMAFLLVHGILHVFGYDHQTPAQRREMKSISSQIIDALT